MNTAGKIFGCVSLGLMQLKILPEIFIRFTRPVYTTKHIGRQSNNCTVLRQACNVLG